MSEVRVTNSKTGGQKGQKNERFDLIPPEELAEVSRVYGKGAKKYSEFNWASGYDWGLSYAALMRHLTQFWCGESYDKESECHHLASVIFHALSLMYFEKHHPDLDNRLVTVRKGQ